MELSLRTFFLVISRVTIIPGSCLWPVLKHYTAKLLYQILGKHRHFRVLCRLDFWEKCSRKMEISVSCFSNVTLWLCQNKIPPWIFFEECSYFFRVLYLFIEPPNNHCFDRAVQGQLSKCNRRNTVTAMRTPIKPHKDLQNVESCPKFCSIKKPFLNVSQISQERAFDEVFS